MKPVTVIGVVLIVLAIVALVHPGIPYKTERDVVRVGPMQTSVETQQTAVVPRALSAGVLAGGIALLVLGLKKKT